MAQSIGVDFQEELKKVFKEIQKQHRFYWYEFTDTRQAGQIVKEQPSDFLIAGMTGAYLLEAKASEKHGSLAQCSAMIRPSQVKHHLLWGRAAQTSLFVFRSYLPSKNCIEFWDGGYVCECKRESKKFTFSEGGIVYQELPINNEEEKLDLLYNLLLYIIGSR